MSTYIDMRASDIEVGDKFGNGRAILATSSRADGFATLVSLTYKVPGYSGLRTDEYLADRLLPMQARTDERTFAQGAEKGGGGVMWRSPVLSDGRPATPYYRARGDVLILVDVTTTPHLLIDNRDGAFSLAHVPYVGALASVLSELVRVD